jgi:hypothetical protein
MDDVTRQAERYAIGRLCALALTAERRAASAARAAVERHADIVATLQVLRRELEGAGAEVPLLLREWTPQELT